MSGLVALVLAVAVAPDEAIELRWSAPIECPDHASVVARVHRLLAAPVGVRVHAQAEVTANANEGWSLALAIETEHGAHTHVWHAERCEALADATALAIAVAADPVELTRKLVPEPPAVAKPLPAAAPKPRPVKLVAATPQAPPRVAIYARAQAMVGVLVLPRIDVGGAITVGLARRRMRIELTGGVLAPRVADLRESSARVRMLAGTIDARGCWMAGERVALGFCGVVELAIVRAEADRVMKPTPKHAAWVGLGVGPLVQIPFARAWQLHLGADALLAVRRPKFAVKERENDVVRPGAVGVRGFVGVAVGTWRRRT
ncbi:MAG TPA: hypothetical protein VG755_08755 [Nannocystaceae bacterium]|nr:hypothetical protein [Nannocystaceae bacterium]